MPTDSVPLSALQHWLFCPRQCALIHIERVWGENQFTAEGRILHERADDGRPESCNGIRILRAVQIVSQVHGLHGVADVVEMRAKTPYPVEYKRGRPKGYNADEVQLCAQALCLEEMTGQPVLQGALFYGKIRRRKLVEIDVALRDLTLKVADNVRSAIKEGMLPAPVYAKKRCQSCSIYDLCRPQSQHNDAPTWLAAQISQAGIPE